MNNKPLPTDTSAPFSCSHWVSFELCLSTKSCLSVDSWIFLEHYSASSSSPGLAAALLGELFPAWPGRDARSDLCWDPPLARVSQR